MKICHIVESFGGGVFYAIRQIANEQIAQGHSVIIVNSIRWDTPSSYKNYFSDKITFYEVNMSIGINVKEQVLSVISLKRIILDNDPDIIHAHSSIAGFYARIFLNKRSNLFYTPHGIAFLRKDVFSISKLVFLLIEKITHKMGGFIIACSKSEYNQIKEKISNKRIYILPNAVPTDALKELKINDRGTTSTIVMAGRISPQKNPSLFIAIKKALDKLNINADYLWLGEGDEYMKRQLINNGIVVTGFLEREYFWTKLSKSTIFLQTSLWEGMPLILMEAQCIGLPIVSNNTLGNADVVKHNFNGFLYNSIPGAIRLIMKLLNDNNLWNHFSLNSREYALDTYSIRNYVNELQEIYISSHHSEQI